MREAQTYYRDANQIDFALRFKHHDQELKDELNLIHRIQALSGLLNMQFRGDMFAELEQCKSDYEEKYGSYELKHFERIAEPGSQLSIF